MACTARHRRFSKSSRRRETRNVQPACASLFKNRSICSLIAKMPISNAISHPTSWYVRYAKERKSHAADGTARTAAGHRRSLCEKEINPFVDEWEKAEEFPSHEVFKKLGRSACSASNMMRPMAASASTSPIRRLSLKRSASAIAAAFPWLSASSPIWRRPLAPVRQRRLKRGWLVPTIAGECGVPRRFGAGRRFRRGGDQDDRAQGWRRLCDLRLENVDHERDEGRLVLPPREHLRRQGASEQVADPRSDGREGDHAPEVRKVGMFCPTPRSFSSTMCACRKQT